MEVVVSGPDSDASLVDQYRYARSPFTATTIASLYTSSAHRRCHIASELLSSNVTAVNQALLAHTEALDMLYDALLDKRLIPLTGNFINKIITSLILYEPDEVSKRKYIYFSAHIIGR